MSGILQLEQVTKTFGGLVAVNGVSFSVDEGEIVGIIGPNGAGKTTIFNLVTGIYKPDQGSIIFNGQEIQGLASHKIAALGMTKTFQTISLFNDMTILDNVMVGALLRNASISAATKKSRHALESVGLDPDQTNLPDDLSMVDRARLEVARALATEPSVLLLDEVMAGLTPPETTEAITMMRKIRDQGITLLVVEHNMRATMTLSERIICFDYGTKIAMGTPLEIKNNPEVIECYLGTEECHVEG